MCDPLIRLCWMGCCSLSRMWQFWFPWHPALLEGQNGHSDKGIRSLMVLSGFLKPQITPCLYPDSNLRIKFPEKLNCQEIGRWEPRPQSTPSPATEAHLSGLLQRSVDTSLNGPKATTRLRLWADLTEINKLLKIQVCRFCD